MQFHKLKISDVLVFLTLVFFYLSLIFLSLGQFSVLFSIGTGKFYIFDVFVGLFVLFGFLLLGKRLRLSFEVFAMYAFVFFGIASLVVNSYLLNASELAVSVFYPVRYMIYVSAGLILFNLILAEMISLKKVLYAFFISALFLSLAGFIQLAILPDFETLDPSLGWDPHKNRLASTFFDPNFLGGYLSLCLGLFIGVFFDGKKFIKNFKGFSLLEWVVFFIIPISALFLTFSRSSWGMFAVIVLIYGLFRSRVVILLSLLLFFGAYFSVPRIQTRLSGITDPSDSAYFRIISWKNTVKIIEDNPVIGVGFNSYRYFQKEYGFIEAGEQGGHSGAGSDSSILLTAATTGILGFLLFVGSYFSKVFYGFKYLDRGGLIIIALFSGLLLHSQFVNSLFFPQIMVIWLFLLAFIPYRKLL